MTMRLKRNGGWFAAGREIEQASALLSDGGFKLFVCLCLQAERASGIARASVAELASRLRRPQPEIKRYLKELSHTGVCCRLDEHRIEIEDRFWPYERTRPDRTASAAETYVAAVRRIFLSRACVRSSFLPADANLASKWCRRGISLESVERAILLGAVRKYVSLLNHNGGSPITTLHYFSALVEEVAAIETSPDYWKYLEFRLPDLERRWRNLQHPAGDQMETK